MKSPLGLLVWKEATELRRDRKVIFFAIVMPAILYPMLMSLSGGLTEKRIDELSETHVTVGVVGKLKSVEDVLAELPNLSLREYPSDLFADSLAALVRAAEVEAFVDLRAGWEAREGDEIPQLIVYAHRSREESREAAERVTDRLQELREAERQRRWESAGGRGRLDDVIRETFVDVASESASAGASTGRMLVYLLLFSVFGAGSAVAMEMIAGEKERGTLETLFLTPFNRVHIARAKLIVATASTMLAGVLMVSSMMLAYRMGWISTEGEAVNTAISYQALLTAALLVLPLAILTAGMLLLISAWVRSLKEGQYYQMPMMMLFFIPAVLSTSQVIQLNPIVAMIPIANVGLAMRDVIIGTANPGLLVIVVVSTLVWGALALKGVTTLMSREATVLGFDPEPVFAQTHGGRLRAIHFSMILGLLAFFYVGQWMQAKWELMGVGLSLWILVPAIAFGVYRFAAGRSAPGWTGLRDTLSLRLPAARWFLIAPLFALGSMLPIAEGIWGLQSRFLPAPELLPLAGLEDISLLTAILLMAVTPAITEELLYRGVCLGLMRRQMSAVWAIAFSALYFSAMHLSVFRIAPTLALGCLFAWIALRSRSIFPAMLCHLVYNGGLVLGGWYGESHEFPLSPTGPFAWAASLAVLGLGVVLARGARSETGVRAG